MWMGFGHIWDSADVYGNHGALSLTDIASHSSSHASFKPLLGLFSHTKLIPLMWCPLSLEFEIVPGATDAIVTPFGA